MFKIDLKRVNVQIIILQFILPKEFEKLVFSLGLETRIEETQEQKEKRTNRPRGILVMGDPVENCSFLEFKKGLSDYVLTKAFVQKRYKSSGEEYFIARFVFFRKDRAKYVANETEQDAFVQLSSCLWRVLTIYNNPMLGVYERIEDERLLSIDSILEDGDGEKEYRFHASAERLALEECQTRH